MTLSKNDKGQYDAYAWPGGYPIFYLFADGGICCPDCANGKNGSDASADTDDPQWKLVASDIHYEGEPLVCDHCGAQIESAYGDPDADEPADDGSTEFDKWGERFAPWESENENETA